MNKIVIGAILLVFIGGIVALVIWIMSGSTTTTSSSSGRSQPPITSSPPPPNDCNKRAGETKTYTLAYSSKKSKSQQSKTDKTYWWSPDGSEPIKCYLDKEGQGQVPDSVCSNYYAIGSDKRGFQCYTNANNASVGCAVDLNGNAYMGDPRGKYCPNDWKKSGWSTP